MSIVLHAKCFYIHEFFEVLKIEIFIFNLPGSGGLPMPKDSYKFIFEYPLPQLP